MNTTVGQPRSAHPEALELRQLIGAELRTPVSAAARALAQELKTKHGDGVLAILYYGSCFRTATEDGGILDLFIIVDRYRRIYTSGIMALANTLLPPNVFYHETQQSGRTVRAKIAIISLADFSKMTSARCFQTYFWARFAQPCALVYARNNTARAAVADAVAGAVETFITRILPALPKTFDAAALWKTGLSATYRTELRPEPPGASARLVDANADRYQRITEVLIPRLPACSRTQTLDGRIQFSARFPAYKRCSNRQAWRMRMVQGKLLNMLRLMKAAFTFDGGVDYVLWKIERHSGIRIEATPMLRRHPLLACWPILWRLYRAGAFR